MADEIETEGTETEPAEVEQEVTETAETEADDTTPEGAESLGDAGKKALDSMKAKWRAERDKRREVEAALAAKTPKPEDDKPDAEAIERTALAKANERIIRAEVKLAAAGKVADPTLALRLIDPASIEVDADGNVDASDIEDAIERLLEQYPSLAAPAKGAGFKGTVTAGNTRKASALAQLSKAELKTMTPEQIMKAKRDGRLKNVLGGN